MIIRVPLGDDTDFTLWALAWITDSTRNITVCAQVAGGRTAETAPDVAPVDTRMHGMGGLAATGALTPPPPRVIT